MTRTRRKPTPEELDEASVELARVISETVNGFVDPYCVDHGYIGLPLSMLTSTYLSLMMQTLRSADGRDAALARIRQLVLEEMRQ